MSYADLAHVEGLKWKKKGDLVAFATKHPGALTAHFRVCKAAERNLEPVLAAAGSLSLGLGALVYGVDGDSGH